MKLSSDQRLESLNELSEFAAALIKELRPEILRAGIDISLDGPLGAGKTTLVRCLAHYLGCVGPVSSPSFVLQHEYHCADGVVLEHWDLYRLSYLPEELCEPPSKLTLRIVEWGKKIPEFKEKTNVSIEISFVDDDPASERRNISLSPAL